MGHRHSDVSCIIVVGRERERKASFYDMDKFSRPASKRPATDRYPASESYGLKHFY